ncbi:unnamed protein product [Fraxinus pennsylvanica]|uniref:Uncharacterized protein n=1 Tax=Fraxinus pennsylvanica TaxID=56036 RepID=A0AAD2EGL1_9LAMI|nr:unnamed protein product [Fraxinus pennsylvanica]
MMEKGKRQKPINLIELLHKSNNFNGVREFDNNRVPNLHSHEPPNSWSLTVVTLTCIAIALPNISNDNGNQLVRCVGEGLSFLKLMEKSLDKNGALAIIGNAADFVWVGVDLYCKWQDKDLRKTSLRGRTSKETLEKLSNEAERTVKQFLGEVNDFLVDNPLNWPLKIIAANSMQKSVRQAALLLGETEDILQILQQSEIPSLDPGKLACIDEWRTFIEGDNWNSQATISTIGSETQQTNEEHVAIELHG